MLHVKILVVKSCVFVILRNVLYYVECVHAEEYYVYVRGCVMYINMSIYKG
jgi:hypothetical protein